MMTITCEQIQKKLNDLLKEQMNLDDFSLPSVPTEFLNIELKNICIRNIDSGKKLIITAEEIDHGRLFVLCANRTSTSPTEYQYVFSFKFKGTYKLDGVKILGKEIKELGFISLDVTEALYGSEENAPIDTATIRAWNQIILSEPDQEDYTLPEDEAIFHGIRLYGTLHIANLTASVSLFLGFREENSFMGLSDLDSIVPDYRRELWHDAQYTFGPITMRRIGLKYSQGHLHFLLDAVLAYGSIELKLAGLGVKTPLMHWDPKQELLGLDLSYDMEALSMAGSLLKSILDTESYAGAVVVETLGRSLSAIGSYSANPGHNPSLFVYAKTNQPLGGPPYLYVKGLGLGFGINRKFLEPAIEDVSQVPLLSDLEPDKVLSELEGNKWIVEEHGTNWLAVGLDFTSFGLIESKALLIGQFAKEFEMLLLGRSELKIPKNNTSPYVFIEIALKGAWKPSEGFVGGEALLTDNSFLLHPNSKIKGGFAASFWYDHEHKGDFAVTSGGYHPHFLIPEHYPKVQRLSLNWPIAGGTIKGESYFAFTPSFAMGGGNLELSYAKSGAKLSLTAYADVLIQWEPFHFEAAFGVTIAASLRISIKHVGSKTFHVELGADLEMWGTPTGGKVSIRFKSLRLTVGFGADRSGAKAGSVEGLLDLLPNTGKIPEDFVGTHIKSGLLKETPDDHRWIVRPDDMSFEIETSIPFTKLMFLGDPYDARDQNDPNQKTLSIRPLGVSNVQDSTLSVSVLHIDSDRTNDKYWDFVFERRNVPEALWGEPIDPKEMRPVQSHIIRTVKITIWPKKPEDEKVGELFLPDGLGFDKLGTRSIDKVWNRQTPGKPKALDDGNKMLQIIQDTINRDDVRKKRDHLISQLMTAKIYNGKNDPLSELKKQVHVVYTEPPLLLKQ